MVGLTLWIGCELQKKRQNPVTLNATDRALLYYLCFAFISSVPSLLGLPNGDRLTAA